MPVVVHGIPASITRQAAGSGPQLPCTAVAVVSPTVIDLTYADAVVATDIITIPASCPNIRTFTGGYAAAAVHEFPGS